MHSHVAHALIEKHLREWLAERGCRHHGPLICKIDNKPVLAHEWQYPGEAEFLGEMGKAFLSVYAIDYLECTCMATIALDRSMK